MTQLVHILNSFTHNGIGGNPAGVVYDPDGVLTDAQMQSVATRIGLSETAFIKDLPATAYEPGAYAAHFFTPTCRVPLCGHATIAAFFLLASRGILSEHILYQYTDVGRLAILIREDEGGLTVYMEQATPKRTPAPAFTGDALSGCFENLEVFTALPTEIWNTGLSDVLLPIASRKALNALNPKTPELRNLSQELGVVGVHAFALEPDGIYARNFAPAYGIPEESATGTSNGALTAYLHHHLYGHQEHFEVEILQGERMRDAQGHTQIGKIVCKSSRGGSVWVGGQAVYMQSIEITI